MISLLIPLVISFSATKPKLNHPIFICDKEYVLTGFVLYSQGEG